jgi:hypothetical protein
MPIRDVSSSRVGSIIISRKSAWERKRLRRSSFRQFQSTHIMNQSAIPTGISASISVSITSFTATDLHSAFRMLSASKEGSRASESSMNPEDAHFHKEGVGDL